MMRNWILCASLALGLSACSQESERAAVATPDTDSNTQNVDARPSEAAVPQTDALEEETTSGRAEMAPTSLDQSAPSSSIPLTFIGVWDAQMGTCSQESDLRLEISPQQIIFYESIGTVRAVNVIDQNTVDLELGMEGEGETWEETYRMSLGNNGSRLTTSFPKVSVASEPVPRKRCPV